MSDLDALRRALMADLGPDAVQVCCSMSRYTTLRVGGPADLLLEAPSSSALARAVTLCARHDVPCRVLGAGANVLVSDLGVRGLVVINRARSVHFADGGVRAESGASLAQVARQCIDAGLAGLEWAVGIPGTVGGAVVGNAGAHGGCVAGSLESATVLEPGGAQVEWHVERFEYGYRSSILKYRPSTSGPKAIVLEAAFRLEPADPEVLEARAASILALRSATQPPGPSCGSVFRNPPGDYAGRLIEAAGLKGTTLGRAQISPLHANFLINLGGASATSIRALVDLAAEEVRTRFGVMLELEIELVGDW